MFVEQYDPSKTDIDFYWEPELKRYFISGLTTNGYPDYRWEHDFVLRTLIPRTPHTILDAGGGVGVLQVLLHKHGHTVHNVDRDPDIVCKISNINAHFQTGVQAYYSGLMSIPFSDNTVDGVVSVSSLEHNTPEDFLKSISELVRVVRPGGYLAVTLPVSATNQETWDSRMHPLWRWSPDKLRRALDQSDLTGLPSFALPKERMLSLAAAYDPREFYPVGIFMRKRGW